MPYELVWEPRCLVRRYRGRVTGAELVESLRRVSADPRFDDVRICIVDYSAVESLAVRDDEAALVAALQIGARYTNPSLVTAHVAPDPGIRTELARLAGLFQPDVPVSIHATLEEARRWSDAPGPAGARAD